MEVPLDQREEQQYIRVLKKDTNDYSMPTKKIQYTQC